MTALPPPSALDADALLRHPRFHACLTASAGELLATHRQIPREVRYLAGLQKWLLSQATLAIHFAHQADPANPPLTPGALQRMLRGTGAASRNTITAFLQEMQHYGLAHPVPGGDRRRHVLLATPATEALIRRWMDTHLSALDLIDAGGRQALLRDNPGLLRQIQPGMTRRILAQPGWLAPPPGVALFTRADSGSNILHHILVRAPQVLPPDCFDAGRVTARDIAGHFLISQSHTARLLARAGRAGLLRWTHPGRQGNCLVSATLVRDYRAWQALKFAALAQAFAQAAGSPATARPVDHS